MISHLPGDQAAEMLAVLDDALQVEVVRRLVNLQQANPEVLLEVERGLESRILEQAIDEQRQTAGMASVAGILAAATPAHEARNPDQSLSPRSPFGRQTGRSRVSLFRPGAGQRRGVGHGHGCRRHAIGRAGLGRCHASAASADARGRARQYSRAIDRALEALGPTRLSDVEEAQHEMARLARELDAEGRIDLSDALAEMVF